MIYEEIAGLFFFRGNSNNNLGNGLKLGTIPYIQKTSSEPLKVKKIVFMYNTGMLQNINLYN